ncbi:hypothetical protein OH77DRAFT_271120 [Trametes cingulata]|nr:hypothetical protein OH77DRAFT_271120 [Trametes cingulata]
MTEYVGKLRRCSTRTRASSVASACMSPWMKLVMMTGQTYLMAGQRVQPTQRYSNNEAGACTLVATIDGLLGCSVANLPLRSEIRTATARLDAVGCTLNRVFGDLQTTAWLPDRVAACRLSSSRKDVTGTMASFLRGTGPGPVQVGTFFDQVHRLCERRRRPRSFRAGTPCQVAGLSRSLRSPCMSSIARLSLCFGKACSGGSASMNTVSRGLRFAACSRPSY